MREIAGTTRIAAVFGWPVEHSLSPPMQNAAIEALGLDWVYIAAGVAPEALAEALRGARAMRYVGVNCTIPHKEAVLPHLDWLDPTAQAMRAVNTIHIVDGEMRGYNTDAYGFTETLLAEGEVILKDKTVLVIGSGGAARGIAAGAAMEGARKVILANRTRPRAEKIAEDIEPAFPETRFEVVQLSRASLQNAAGRAEVIANATSLGMGASDPLPIEPVLIQPGHVIFESVYVPAETPLLRAARERGAIAVGGLGMLARQGARSLSIWSGMEPDEDLMLNVLRKAAYRKGSPV
jgi:shikimate dehydrogenase